MDVAEKMGIRYVANQPRERPRDILDANGSGCAFLDYDGDGKLDVLLVGDPGCALYRNEGTHFRDVTKEAGLDRHAHWIGVGVGDVDNDGFPDLCLTGYHTGAFFHNNHGHFRDETAQSGIAFPTWGQSVAFGDVNNDGILDLYIGAYAEYGPTSKRYCDQGGVKTICGPELYRPERGRLFLGAGKCRFKDVTRDAGMGDAHGRSWGAAFQDFDDDGRQDLFIGNDMLPCDLYHNVGKPLGSPKFRNVGVSSGTAFDAAGHLLGAMAADWADYDNDGRPDLLVTAFTAQPTSLYHNEGDGNFAEASYAAGVGQSTTPYVGFGAKFLDFDNDGWRDLLLTNGHVEEPVEKYRSGEHYRQPLLLLHNRNGHFENVSASLLHGLPEIVARGAAFGDFNNDGKLDVLVMDLEGQPLLLMNQAPGGNWLGLRLVGRKSNRDGLGARVTITAGASRQRFECQTSGSVLSSNDPRILAGIGAATQVDQITVRWPSGVTTTLRNVPADQYLTVQER